MIRNRFHKVICLSTKIRGIQPARKIHGISGESKITTGVFEQVSNSSGGKVISFDNFLSFGSALFSDLWTPKALPTSPLPLPCKGDERCGQGRLRGQSMRLRQARGRAMRPGKVREPGASVTHDHIPQMSIFGLVMYGIIISLALD